ncbi:hypothetical protein BH10PLA2_BH10PLA2_30570 [soil metagenome]
MVHPGGRDKSQPHRHPSIQASDQSSRHHLEIGERPALRAHRIDPLKRILSGQRIAGIHGAEDAVPHARQMRRGPGTLQSIPADLSGIYTDDEMQQASK